MSILLNVCVHPETQGIVSFLTHGQGRPPRSICACLIRKAARGLRSGFAHLSRVQKKMFSSGCYEELQELFRAATIMWHVFSHWELFFKKKEVLGNHYVMC